MSTISEILDQGSCFGVTDPSQLRPSFRCHLRASSGLCEGCEGKKRHHCARFVRVVSVATSPKGRLKVKHGKKPCQCQKAWCKRKRKK